MPTYSYACTSCDHAFDIVQSMSEDSLTECPACQGRLRKLFTNVGVVFKGSGFYRTDSRSGSTSGSSDSTTPAPAGGSSSSDSSSSGSSPSSASSGSSGSSASGSSSTSSSAAAAS